VRPASRFSCVRLEAIPSLHAWRAAQFLIITSQKLIAHDRFMEL